MNIKLAIALFTCSIIANSSVFAMDPDKAKGHTSVLPKKPAKNPWGSDKFLKSVHDEIRAGFRDPNIDRSNDSKSPAKE